MHGDEVNQFEPSVFNFPRLPRGPVVGCGVWKHFTDVPGPHTNADAESDANTNTNPNAHTDSDTKSVAGPRGREHYDQPESGT